MTDSIIITFISQNRDNFIFNIPVENKEEISSHCIDIILNDKTESTENFILTLECTKLLARDVSFEKYLCRKEIWLKLFEISGICDYAEQVGSSICLLNHSASIVESCLKVLCNMTKNFSSTIPIDLRKSALAGILNRVLLYDQNVPEITTNIKIFEMKLLFLLTAFYSELRFPAIRNCDCIHRLSAVFKSQLDSIKTLTEEDLNLDSEILKCLFNVLYQQMDEELEKKVDKEMNGLIVRLRDLLVVTYSNNSFSETARIELLSNTANLLTSVSDSCFQYLIYESDNHSESDLYKDPKSMRFYQLILILIERRLKENSHLLETLSPLMQAMGKACLANRNIRKFYRLKILPYMKNEVMQLPEQGNSTRNKLCKLLQHHCEQVTESVAFFLFVLCKEDVERAIKYTGFGNFAGFLARHALLAGRKRNDNTYSDSEDSDTKEYLDIRDKINPVTGRVEEERSDPLEGMTEEQKEYEVVCLMNQIDKLHRQGIIKPGIIGDDGSVRPADSVLEVMERVAQQKNYQEKDSEDSD